MADGVLYVEIVPTTRNIGKGITGDLDKQLAGTEKKSQSMFGKVAKWGAVAIGAVGAAVAGLAIAGGISRALNIEDAQAKLKGLGHDTQSVQAIMNDALASVRGTAFGLDTAASVAATAVAAGIKPGQELEKYLRLTADAATIAGVSMEEMGSILNKTTTAGKVYTAELNQMADRGLPIFQWLQDEYQVTAEELRKMVAAGEVDSETFRRVIEENIGGAALASGDTTRGAFKNMLAAFSRLGAMFAGPGLESAKAFFGEITELADGIGERLQPLADGFGNILAGIDISNMAESILGFFDNLDIASLISGAMSGRASFIEVGLGVVQSLLEGIIAGIPQIVQGAADMITRILEVIVGMAPSLIGAAVELFMGLLDAVITVLPSLIQTIVGLVPQIASALISMIPVLLQGAVTLLMAILDAIPVIIPLLVEALISILPVLLETLVSLIPALIDGALQLFLAIVMALPEIIPALITAVLDLLPVLISTLVGLIPALIKGAVQLFTGIVKALPEIIPALVKALIDLGPVIVQAIIDLIPQLFQAGVELIQGLIDGVMSMFGAIGDAFGGIMDFIGGFFPSSPAERGPFSGYGWIKHGRSGEAFMDQWLSGVSSADVSGTMTHTLAAASLAGAAASSPAIYVQNPFTGEYLLARVGREADARIQTAGRAKDRAMAQGWRRE